LVGVLYAAVLLPVPVLALLAFGSGVASLQAGDDLALSAVPSFDAPAAAVAEANAADTGYRVAVVEQKSTPGEEPVLSLDNWEDTEDTAFNGPRLKTLPRGIALDVINPIGGPIFLRPDGSIQTFIQFRRIRSGRFRGQFLMIFIVRVLTGRPSPS